MPRVRALAVVLALVVLAAACTLPLSTPGSTTAIQFVSTSTTYWWKYDYYRNTAYPCAISGYQTFVIGTKVGSSNTTPRPLWVFMHGGGAGYFDENGNPQPTAGQKSEEPVTRLVDQGVGGKGLLLLVRNDPAAFRTVSVSYDHARRDR